MSLTVLHGSDLHFGKLFDPEIAGVFRSAIGDLSPDLLILSGDFTQRAKVEEFRAARDFLQSLPELPLVVTPGNHDVPLYRFWERIFSPLGKYTSFISPELDTVTRVEGAVVVALNSTAPLRAIVNGRIRDRQLLFAAQAFRDLPGDVARVVVFHHHLVPAPDYEADQVLPGFQRCLGAFEAMKVDLILGGHLHRAYVANSLDSLPRDGGGAGLVIAHAGTATSRRGRARERNKNSFNLIGITADQILITHYLFLGRGDGFVPVGTHAYPRRNRGFLRVDPVRKGMASTIASGEAPHTREEGHS
jgi:3',5'-cyclic AMP phosphodiesterase CpdA